MAKNTGNQGDEKPPTVTFVTSKRDLTVYTSSTRKIVFENGEYSTNNKAEIAALKRHKSFGPHFRLKPDPLPAG